MKVIHSLLTTLLLGCAATASEEPIEQVRLFLVGDSTASVKQEQARPETGWGEKLDAFFLPSVTVFNHARNGRSSKSFRDEGLWQATFEQLQPGDYVFIQFGHNDQKANDPQRFTNPYSSYRDNLRRYVADTLSRGAIPVLLSPIVRRSFNEAGSLVDSHGPYPAVARDLARELAVDFIDLHTLSERLVTDLGPEASQSLYLHLPAGAHHNYPQGIVDDTHLNGDGASAIAELATGALCEQSHPLASYLKGCADHSAAVTRK